MAIKVKKQRYFYFISYHYTTYDGEQGFGRTEMSLNHIISDIQDISEAETLKEQIDKYLSVLILNYNLLRIEEWE